MKQVLQNLANGEIELVEAPAPQPRSGHLVVDTRVSLISAGTERMLVDFGKANYLEKARQQPDKVRMVLDKVRTDGLASTVEAVRSRLAEPLPMGYSNVGTVSAVGADTTGFQVGQRVVSNGPHAQMVCVPKNLCAVIPDAVSDEEASFTVLASIGLQGIRLASPTLGESVVVIGAGLIGLITIQMLRANGCQVLAVDFDDAKLALAQQFGARICNPASGADPVASAAEFSAGRGVDAVLVTASTKSSDPVSQAARMCRKRGRIVLVGVTGLELRRDEFYEKELTFQVSCSYGPGRYDPAYEQRGQDYPLGFVRWTEQRNFEAALQLMADGVLQVKPLISERFAFEQAAQAYEYLSEQPHCLGLVLDYTAQASETVRASRVPLAASVAPSRGASLAVVGAGNYASRMLIPALRARGAHMHTLVSQGGVSAAVQGQRAGFAHAGSAVADVLADDEVDAVVIATRHDSHADLVVQAQEAGKHVFVEKPLGIRPEEIDRVEAVWRKRADAGEGRQLYVGYNRRFAPQVMKMRELLGSVSEPKVFIMTMNAGSIPADHWTQQRDVGGGRIIGEACHYIDLMRCLAGAPIRRVSAHCVDGVVADGVRDDKASITLEFEDGSLGTILYLANGAASFPKERIEVFAAGRVLQLDNFRKLRGFGWPGFKRFNLWKQDKGQVGSAAAFLQAMASGEPAIPMEEIFEVARAAIDAADQLAGA